MQEDEGRAVVAVGHGEHRYVKLGAPSVYGEVHLPPIKLTVTPGAVALADETLIRLLRMAQRGADVLADGRVAYLEARTSHCCMDVARLHAELPVAPLALLLIVAEAHVDERADLTREHCPVPLGNLV